MYVRYIYSLSYICVCGITIYMSMCGITIYVYVWYNYIYVCAV